jgi:lipopolysaccharide heptosyltransferase II
LRILLIRLRRIGDVVFTTPAVAALRRQYPQAHLAYLVEPEAAAIVTGNPHLDEVIVAPRRKGVGGFLADLSLGRRLRRARYDLVIDFHGGPRASLLTLLSGAPRRVGYKVIARHWMYTDVVERPRGLRRRHSVENQWDLVRPIGVAAPTPAANPVEMALDPGARGSIEKRLAVLGVGRDEELAVMHVSASSPFRRWPLSSFVETAAALASRDACRVIVTSGPAERAAADGIVDQARRALPANQRHRVISASDFSLAELRALLEQSAVFIGGDSGPLHVAATTRVPIVAIFGPTPSERSLPWRNPSLLSAAVEIDGLECRPCDQRVCAPGDFRCLTRIDAPRVVAAAERLLAAHRGSTRGVVSKSR